MVFVANKKARQPARARIERCTYTYIHEKKNEEMLEYLGKHFENIYDTFEKQL